MKKSIDVKTHTITFTFDGLAPVVFDADKANDDIRDYAMLHGFQARIGDNAAIARKDAGGTVTEAMRREAVLELVAHYESGASEWALKATRAAPQNPTILAIAAKLNISYVEAEAEIQRRMLAEIEEA